MTLRRRRPGLVYPVNEDWIYVGSGGSAPAFENSWVNFGDGSVSMAFRSRETGIVDLQGRIKSGTVSAAAFTLPVGYRPTTTTFIPAIGLASSTEVPVLIIVGTDGTVKPTGVAYSPSSVYIAGQVFLVPPT